MDKREFLPIFKDFQDSPIEAGTPEADLAIWNAATLLDANYNLDILSVIKLRGRDLNAALRSRVPDHFCLYPFTNFQLDPDGRARPCCKYKVGDATWQEYVPKLPEANIQELWEQPELTGLRAKFLRGEKPAGCKACWEEEAAGIPSMRLTRQSGGKQHPFATFFHHVPRQTPSTLDFKLSNLCNFKCRICTPFLSSQWIKEAKDLNIEDMGTHDSFTVNAKEKFSEDPNNKLILKTWAPNVKFLEFYGGEPLMQQEHDEILDIMHEYGNPLSMSLYYNTNSSICKEQFFKKWQLFGEVHINFSIDDIDQRFEYQRKNGKWKETVANVATYQLLSKKYNVNMHIKLYVTVSILNVFYLNEFFTAVQPWDVKITLNMVHYPHHYAIHILPKHVKDVIKEKLELITTGNLHQNSPSIQQIINFMYGAESNTELMKTFFEKTELHDTYRGESFSDTFPELYAILKGKKNEK